MIVLDSSFLIGYHNPRDVHHTAARQIMSRFHAEEWGGGLLLEYVFLEVVTVIQARLSLAAAVRFGDRLLGARELEFLPCSDIFLPTVETFRLQSPTGLSFADAAIVTAARRNPPGHVATFDRGFHGVAGVTVVDG